MRCSKPIQCRYCGYSLWLWVLMLLVGGCASAARPYDTVGGNETVEGMVTRLQVIAESLRAEAHGDQVAATLDQAQQLNARALSMTSSGDHSLAEVRRVLDTAERHLVLARARLSRIKAQAALEAKRQSYVETHEANTELNRENAAREQQFGLQ